MRSVACTRHDELHVAWHVPVIMRSVPCPSCLTLPHAACMQASDASMHQMYVEHAIPVSLSLSLSPSLPPSLSLSPSLSLMMRIMPYLSGITLAHAACVHAYEMRQMLPVIHLPTRHASRLHTQPACMHQTRQIFLFFLHTELAGRPDALTPAHAARHTRERERERESLDACTRSKAHA
jgi:hypothetical protein